MSAKFNGICVATMGPKPLDTAILVSTIFKTWPVKKPNIKPKIPPKEPIMTDSAKNSIFTSWDFIPIAFIKPTSLVFSNKDTVKVLNIPRAATLSAIKPKTNKPNLKFLNKLLILSTVSTTELVRKPIASISCLLWASLSWSPIMILAWE